MVSVRVKKQITLDHLTFNQQAMLKLATVGTASLLNRVRLGRNTADAAAKPLKPAYARWKLRHGLIPRRDLWGLGSKVLLPAGKRRKAAKFSPMGHMLDNLSVRTVSENSARIGFTLEQARIKALANTRIEPFLLFSPKNQEAIMNAARLIFAEISQAIVKPRGARAA